MTDTLTPEQRLRSTTEEMANTASVPMELWDRHSNACLEAADELARLSAELAEARKALAFYADTSKYPAPSPAAMRALWYDCGQIARAALASTKETSDAD